MKTFRVKEKGYWKLKTGNFFMTVQTRVVIIWASLILLGLPLTWIVFNDFSLVVEHIEVLAAILLTLSLAVSGWRLKKGLKRRMQGALGRKVDDNELISITAWMKIPQEAKVAAREAEKYDFDTRKR